MIRNDRRECYLVEFDVESFDFISYIIIQMSKKEIKCHKKLNDKEVTVVRKEHFDNNKNKVFIKY